MKRAIPMVLVTGLSTIAGADVPDPSADTPAPVVTLTEPTSADLTVKQLPAKLTMRPKPVPAKTKAKPKATAAAGAASADADLTASSDTGYKKFPTTFRDIEDRVKFRFNTGVDLENAPASGQTLKGGQSLPPGFTDSRPWILGDVMVGARGVVVPSLGGYFLSSYAFDASDSLATRAANINPTDANGERINIKAGYAEWGRDDRAPDDAQPSKLWLRGGRQFRLDGGNMFAYFDGATIGYKEKAWNVSAFAGQRVVLYIDSPPGILYGATAALNLTPGFGPSDKKKEIPIKLAADFMGLAIDVPAATGGTINENRHMVALTGSAKFSEAAKLDIRARLTGLPDTTATADANGQFPEKFAVGRLGARFRYEAGNLIFIGDVEERFGDDLAYDLATPSAVDIVQIAQKLGIGLNQPVDATDLGLRVDYWNKEKDVELLLFGRTEQPSGTPINVDQKAYIEAGVGLAGSPIGSRGAGIWTTAQYTFRSYTQGTCGATQLLAMDPACPNAGVGSSFGDGSVDGLDSMHQVAVEGTLSTKPKDGKHWRFAAGGFFRVYNFSTPYREVTNDARAGGSADLQWWFKREVHLDVAGEVAQPSPTLSRDIDVMSSIRGALEVQW